MLIPDGKHLEPALRCRFRHTAICVFEKNYRLQDIQLSKNLGNQLRFQTYRPAQSIREPTSNSCPPSPFGLRRDSLRNLESCLASRSSLRLATSGKPGGSRAKAGGEYRARTGDLLVANQALSQLS